MNNLYLATPEIFLLTATCLVLVIDLFLDKEDRHVTYWLAQLSLVITLVLAWSQLGTDQTVAFSGAYVVDTMSTTLKSWILLIAIFGFVYSREYVDEHPIANGEYYVLGLFGVMGMMIMVSAHSMLTLYLGLELLALSLYAMVALKRDSAAASEAAMKYFVLGALASGMLLYGMSMVYGATGSLDLANIHAAITDGGERSVAARFGLTFIIVGLAFKLGAVPFHMWLPDVYDGAPTSVTLYIATAPKIAAFAMVIRLLVDGLQGLQSDWMQMLAILAALSLVVGNLIAIAQTNIKRMLAYSTISHVGFLLLGMVAGTAEGYSASMFYAITYALTTAAAFGVLLALSRQGVDAVDLDDLKGLARRNVLLASVMMLALISLAGVPPLVGFYAKLAVLKAVINGGFLWLAVLAVFMSVVGAFYYLRVIKLMFFDEPAEGTEISAPADITAALAVNGAAVLAFGLFPGLIMAVCLRAFG
ncbi:MAG: NADH-quinone oxidoreductase subunit NuoN [Gammaproteobacteria bacterium]|nr:NADH-quinone oxidoreductase subunit NuoN [Gammaproteobacteria bacterium]